MVIFLKSKTFLQINTKKEGLSKINALKSKRLLFQKIKKKISPKSMHDLKVNDPIRDRHEAGNM